MTDQPAPAPTTAGHHMTETGPEQPRPYDYFRDSPTAPRGWSRWGPLILAILGVLCGLASIIGALITR
jgi:hypothetical protein